LFKQVGSQLETLFCLFSGFRVRIPVESEFCFREGGHLGLIGIVADQLLVIVVSLLLAHFLTNQSQVIKGFGGYLPVAGVFFQNVEVENNSLVEVAGYLFLIDSSGKGC